ncbi:MAG: hypothetical protein AAF479_18140 [Pseudomonadota bacterium]
MTDFVREMIEIKSLRPSRKITAEDVHRWSDDQVRDKFYEEASLEIARRFHYGWLDYGICDAIMNDLWWLAIYGDEAVSAPPLFLQVFEAFDAGEFYRSSEQTDDPVDQFTRPKISKLLSAIPRVTDRSED